MSGALKEVRNRIKSVQSTQQITQSDEDGERQIAPCPDAITQMRPYAKIQEMLSNIVSSSEGM